MADGQNNPTIKTESFSSGSAEPESGRNWAPMLVGAVLVLVVVTCIVVFVRNKPLPIHTDPYIAKLQISNLHMETAQNFAGGSVTYIEGAMANAGDQKIVGARAQVIFRNSLGELVGDPVLPVMVLQPGMPIADYGSLEHAPLGPGQSRDFRLTLEHVSTDWNGQLPQVKVVAVESPQ